MAAAILTQARKRPNRGARAVLDSGERAAATMNCHLVVSDLFWPAAAGADPYREPELPALETLLARGRRARIEGASLERWLAAAYRIASGRDLPLAPLALRGDGGEPGDHWWMQADPVHLKVHRDRLMLADASRLAITPDEARQLTGALNAHFAPEGILFVAPRPERWYASIATPPRIATTPTAEVAGRDIERFLPEGADGARWRGLINEAQMLMHRHPCNENREARGELPINSVWFWGAGRETRLAADAPYAEVWSDHPLAAGLAAASGTAWRSLPDSGTSLVQSVSGGERGRPHLVVLPSPPGAAYGDIAAWRGAVAALERDWFGTLLAGVQEGALDQVTLHGLGPDFGVRAEYSRNDRYKFWRPRPRLDAYAG